MPPKRSGTSSRRPTAPVAKSRSLIVVFGDQLDHASDVLGGIDREHDVVLMMELTGESRHVPSHVQRTVLFLSAMRHFRDELRAQGIRVHYVTLDDPANTGSFTGEVIRAIELLRPDRIVCVHPGEWRVLLEVEQWPARTGLPVSVVEDSHFLASREEFRAWASDRKSLTMEYFYREQRRKTGYLMVGKGARAVPEGGAWNFDHDNRASFGSSGPPITLTPVKRFAPDAMTREVIDVVRRLLPDLPGRLERDDDFGWPVTRAEALASLDDFLQKRLPSFGPYQDAMWTDATTLFHAVISPALNLKLLNPRECCDGALAAYRQGRASLQSVEAFIRQIIGWREFIRGVYWHEGPSYAERNTLEAHGSLPSFYWSGETDMNCMRHCIGQVLDTAYGHHIQRLMVTGNFALMSGVHPKRVSDWYLGMFADGVDWVTLPNALGMVMHADARPNSGPGVTGLVGTKPYAASGKYVDRMSNYCTGCRYNPEERSGPSACPFTVFYWDFLLRHRERFAKNQRMSMILKNVERMSAGTVTEIRLAADLLRTKFGIEAKSRA